MPQIALDLPANVDAPARARHALRDITASLDTTDRWRAEMIVTELVTNAVLHGPGGPVRVAVDCGGRGVRGQVADPGPGIARGPAPRQDALNRGPGERGRGLRIVEQLSDGWGTSHDVSRVWFELASRA